MAEFWPGRREAIDQLGMRARCDDGDRSAVTRTMLNVLWAEQCDRCWDDDDPGSHRPDHADLPLGYGREKHHDGLARRNLEGMDGARKAVDGVTQLAVPKAGGLPRSISEKQRGSVVVDRKAIDHVSGEVET